MQLRLFVIVECRFGPTYLAELAELNWPSYVCGSHVKWGKIPFAVTFRRKLSLPPLQKKAKEMGRYSNVSS